ncbi:conserved Plasmodium membrane protein, unknown function [Plasmodium relictum]|uniref:Uncharacterized protein n=1 Tax=Plasmodium relictum TaxID=85471 RepID=A0A1J1H4P1_PLARL|nr:conserved Plasmodium membrane protein, unknown function [Plasmodium relictum]CRG99879.1 conserved Plasmodium membrane protein, unknown function [Plasmodium relictum]
MINFETFLLLNDEILKPYSFFEKVLTYYILKRLVKYLLVKYSKNYTIEICSCNELNVNNLFYSKYINFYKLQNDRRLLNFFRIILKEKKTDFKMHYNKHDIYIDNHSNKWNNNILKILYFYYNQLKNKNKLKCYGNFFLSFSTFIISLLHYENNVIKKKDKILFLFLFLLFFTTNSPMKKRNLKRFFNKKKKNTFFSDYKELYNIVYTHFNKVKIKDVQKLFKNHLFHIHIFNENVNEEKKSEKKKKVLILCKKTLFYLNEICANYIKLLNQNYNISNLKDKEQLLKSFCLLKSYDNKYHIFSLYNNTIMNRKKNNFCHLHVLLKNIYKNKLISKENMKKIIYFLRKKIVCTFYFKKYLKLFYYKFLFKYKKLRNNHYVIKYKNMKKHQKENKRLLISEINFIEEKKKSSFTLICAYICLINNNNYYNLYYFFIYLLKKNKSISFHEQINYFINEIAKIDAKCQYIWNMKNMFFYFYVQMYLKENLNIIKKGKSKRNLSNVFLFFLRIIINSNKYKIYKKKKKLIFTKSIIKTDIYNKKRSFKKYIIQKLYNNKNTINSWDFRYNSIYYKNKKKHKCVIMKNFLKYLRKNFDFFFKILECKSYNYMATSHIFILYNFLFFFCLKKKKKKNGCNFKIYSIKNILYKNYRIILHNNIYYYAFHNLFLMLYIQKIYHFLIQYLNNFFFVIFKKNIYTYNFNSLIIQKSYKQYKNPFNDKFYRNNYYSYDNIYKIDNTYNNKSSCCYKFNSSYKKKNNSDISKVDIYNNFYYNINNINNIYYNTICNNYNNYNSKNNLSKLIIDRNQLNQINKNHSLNAIVRSNFIYINNTYLEFYIFPRKKYCRVGSNINIYFLYERIKYFLINYKTNLKDMIKFLRKFYKENYYLSFYTNTLRNIFYCICNCNSFFYELFYNLIIPLLFQKNYSNTKKKKKTVIALLHDFDCYFMKELKFLKKHYTLIKIKYEEKYRQMKINNKFLRIYSNYNKTYSKSIKNNKKWITNNFHIFSINRDLCVYNMLISFNKLKNKKTKNEYQNFSLRNYYFIFFKCVINLIHEYSIYVYHILKKSFYTEKNIPTYFNKHYINNLDNNFNKINTNFIVNKVKNDLNYTKYNNPKNRIIKKNINDNNKCNVVKDNDIYNSNINNSKNYKDKEVTYFYLNLKENLNFLYKIYKDIFHFFEVFKKNNFILFYVLKKLVLSSKKIKKKIFFLKSFFSINFLMFLCEHTYIFYILKEIYKILRIIFSKKFYISN